ncbi:MAG: RagB/SusD family nutrient uptake outer membrane protein, partial [Bacteroidia bacterium]
MKKFTLFLLMLSVMTLGSCKKFLVEYSQDEMRPSTTEDLAALMYSEAYPYLLSIDNFDLLTDDIQSNGLSSVNGVQLASYVSPFTAGTPIFTFDPTMFDANNVINAGSNLYQIYYAKVKGCNVIIDQLEKVSGTSKEKNAILGQCLFLRSFYFLKIATLYSQCYNGQGVNPETNMGIPLVLSSQVRDGGLKRSTLKETYDQIEKDLLSAASLLKDNYT